MEQKGNYLFIVAFSDNSPLFSRARVSQVSQICAFDTWAKLALLPHGGAQRDTVKKTPVGGNGQWTLSSVFLVDPVISFCIEAIVCVCVCVERER